MGKLGGNYVNGNEKQQTSVLITVIMDKIFTYLSPATSKLIKEGADVLQ